MFCSEILAVPLICSWMRAVMARMMTVSISLVACSDEELMIMSDSRRLDLMIPFMMVSVIDLMC